MGAGLSVKDGMGGVLQRRGGVSRVGMMRAMAAMEMEMGMKMARVVALSHRPADGVVTTKLLLLRWGGWIVKP